MWVADLTEQRTDEGKIYLCAIKDLWSNRIVGWAIDERMKALLVVVAVEVAGARRGDVAGCVLHSDRGSQFRSRKVQRCLTRHQMAGSMGNVATAADNAATESFFSLLQKTVLNTHRWATRDKLCIAIISWIERNDHQRRRRQNSSTPSRTCSGPQMTTRRPNQNSHSPASPRRQCAPRRV